MDKSSSTTSSLSVRASSSSSEEEEENGPSTEQDYREDKGYLNFVREFRSRNQDLGRLETLHHAPKYWLALSPGNKAMYRTMDSIIDVHNSDSEDTGACCPQKVKKPACPKKRKPARPKKPACPMKRKPACPPRCPRKPKKCAKRRKKCSKPGPVTNNAYLNFIRAYRKKHCNLKPKDLVRKAARAWCRLPEHKRNRYRRMACKVTISPRHKRRRVCTGK